jgi:hypothetical protein
MPRLDPLDGGNGAAPEVAPLAPDSDPALLAGVLATVLPLEPTSTAELPLEPLPLWVRMSAAVPICPTQPAARISAAAATRKILRRPVSAFDRICERN